MYIPSKNVTYKNIKNLQEFKSKCVILDNKNNLQTLYSAKKNFSSNWNRKEKTTPAETTLNKTPLNLKYP